MESDKEFNKELKEQVNLTFVALAKEIGTNRAQLANKVLSFHKEINRELSNHEVDDKRKEQVLSEVARIVKMASQQLPHLKRIPPRPVVAQPTVAKPVVAKPVVVKPTPPKPVPVKSVATKPAPAAKRAAKPAPKKKKK